MVSELACDLRVQQMGGLVDSASLAYLALQPHDHPDVGEHRDGLGGDWPRLGPGRACRPDRMAIEPAQPIIV